MRDLASIEPLLRTLLFEGYVLFPYRATALKNRVRTSFGELVPSGGFGRTEVHAEMPVEGGLGASVSFRVAFLQPVRRTVLDASGAAVESLEVGGELHQTWEEAREQSFVVGPVAMGEALQLELEAPALVERHELVEGTVRKGTIERRAEASRCRLVVGWRAVETEADVTILRCALSNTSSSSDARSSTLHAAHVSMRIEGGAFVSVIDPPAALRCVADACENDGLWAFLAGPVGDRSLAVCSPIIVYDHPDIAPESPGDSFDATENDELLTLAVLAMTEPEKRAMAATDPRARELLRRSEALGARLDDLHGTVRAFRTAAPPRLRVGGALVGVGDRVELAPTGRDPMDAALTGKRATVVDIRVEAQGREHLVVVIDDDPGRDFGLVEDGLGHRFFVSPAEVRPVRGGELP